MKIIILCFLVSLGHTQSLKQLGNTLFYQDSKEFFQIMDFKNSYSQGYDFVDSTNILIAYDDPERSEGVTIFRIFNLVNRDFIDYIDRIGSTGDSQFTYNKENDLVLFNWYNGLYVFRLHDDEGYIIRNAENRLIPVLKDPMLNACNFYYPFWIDSIKIGYSDFSTGVIDTKYMKINLSNF
jgi:hypothetical protein